MNKSLIALATAAVAIAATVGQAEAGFRIGIGFGFGPVFNHHGNGGGYVPPHKSRVHRAVRVKEPVRAARKVQPKTTVAKTEDKPAETVAHNESSSIALKVEQVASVENSSIAAAATPEAKKVEPITETKKTVEAANAIEPVVAAPETKKSEPAVAQKVDCKKFFPSVGLTLTVPCE